MGGKLKALEQRQRELQHRAAVERRELAIHFEPWEKPLSWADKGVDVFHFVKNNPALWSTAFAVLVHYKPKFASKALALGWGAMKLLKGVKSIL
jgi:hypothetical protein